MSYDLDSTFTSIISTIKNLSNGNLPRPPHDVRVKLYGLYKQATEGDVRGLMPRPVGNSTLDAANREKYDSWKLQEGLTKSQAKKRYIEAVVSSLALYGGPEANDISADLQAKWEKIKDMETPDGSNAAVSYPGALPSAANTNQHFLHNPEHDSSDSLIGGIDDESPERVEMKKFRRDVTWALETISEEILALKQRSERHSVRRRDGGQDGGDDQRPKRSKSWAVFLALVGFVGQAVKRFIVDIALLLLVIRIVKWLKMNPQIRQKIRSKMDSYAFKKLST